MASKRRTGRHRATPESRGGRIVLWVASGAVAAIAAVASVEFLPEEPPDRSTLAGALTARPDARTSTEGSPTAPLIVEAARTESGKQALSAQTSLALPPRSGNGRRVVFSEGRQRVWMVDEDGAVVRHYPVSGSVYDNLEPGTYEVYSRSRWAVGIDDSGTMEYFVRFTQGTQGAAIGFHTIPVDDGRPVQKVSELGTPLSHGCIRQDRSDAIAMWEFAPEGTTVVVTP